MEYRLMHQNKTVMHLELDEVTGSILKAGEIANREHLPLGVAGYRKEIDRGALNRWWQGRSIPASRSGLREALELLEIALPQTLAEKCLGLSLSDQYWICPAKQELRWEDVNFFDHAFSEDVGNALFGRKSDSTRLNLMSPDNTSDGWLRKKWVIYNGKRYLMKGGSGQVQQEPFNEVFASRLMARSGMVDFVPYTLHWEDDMPYSLCENFITRDTELVSAGSILQAWKKPNHVSLYRHFSDCCATLGIPNAREGLNHMLTIDFLIANTDRHLNNFGAVRNAETLEWLGLAPIFDCGTSLWNDLPTSKISMDADIPSKPFQPTHTRQIALVTDFGWLDFMQLDGMREELEGLLAENPYMDEYRRGKLCDAFDGRISALREIVLEQKRAPDMGMQL